MKKIILLIFSLYLVSYSTAVTFAYDGVIRTRAAMYNDLAESSDDHIDSRLRLGINSELAPKLNFRTRLQFGNVIWGDAATGGSINSAVKISAYELYLDYRMDSIEANVRFGQQCWADPMALIIDGSFSGVMLTKDELLGFKTELGFIKSLEVESFVDDHNYFLLNMSSKGKSFWGLLTSFYHTGASNSDSFTLMPYVHLKAEPVQVKAAVFMGAHFDSPEEEKMGFGTAIKAKAGLGGFNLGADVLFATENGIATLFPYYMNGLYIYGIGLYNDSVNLYWNTPYSSNPKASFSAVGSISAPLGSGYNLFGAAGYLSDQGFEVNMGIEHDLIPKKAKIAGYAAAGFHEITETTNYVFGISIVVPF
jgi:hypothetical protein